MRLCNLYDVGTEAELFDFSNLSDNISLKSEISSAIQPTYLNLSVFIVIYCFLDNNETLFMAVVASGDDCSNF